MDKVRTKVERTLGQTQDLEHHWHAFNKYLNLLPHAIPGTANKDSGAHLQHRHWSLSPGVPEELAGYHSACKLVMGQHARTPFATVYDSYLWCLTENKALSAVAVRAFDSKGNRLTQHWIDFCGRVLQGATKAQQRQLIGAAEYVEQPLTVQTARSLLAPQRYQQQQSKGKVGWQRRYGKSKGGGYGNSSAPAPTPAPAPHGQPWAKKPLACWRCELPTRRES